MARFAKAREVTARIGKAGLDGAWQSRERHGMKLTSYDKKLLELYRGFTRPQLKDVRRMWLENREEAQRSLDNANREIALIDAEFERMENEKS